MMPKHSTPLPQRMTSSPPVVISPSFPPFPVFRFKQDPHHVCTFSRPSFVHKQRSRPARGVEIDGRRHESGRMASGWPPALPISGFDRQPPRRGRMPVFPRFLSFSFLSPVYTVGTYCVWYSTVQGIIVYRDVPLDRPTQEQDMT